MCVRVCAKILTVDGGLGAMGLDGRAHCIMLAMKRNACSAILTVCIAVALSEVAGLYVYIYKS